MRLAWLGRGVVWRLACRGRTAAGLGLAGAVVLPRLLVAVVLGVAPVLLVATADPLAVVLVDAGVGCFLAGRFWGALVLDGLGVGKVLDAAHPAPVRYLGQAGCRLVVAHVLLIVIMALQALLRALEMVPLSFGVLVAVVLRVAVGLLAAARPADVPFCARSVCAPLLGAVGAAAAAVLDHPLFETASVLDLAEGLLVAAGL